MWRDFWYLLESFLTRGTTLRDGSFIPPTDGIVSFTGSSLVLFWFSFASGAFPCRLICGPSSLRNAGRLGWWINTSRAVSVVVESAGCSSSDNEDGQQINTPLSAAHSCCCCQGYACPVVLCNCIYAFYTVDSFHYWLDSFSILFYLTRNSSTNWFWLSDGYSTKVLLVYQLKKKK